MSFKMRAWVKIVLLLVFLAGSFIGFMIKLPSVFRSMDKEMHALFYFAAACFLNILFVKRHIFFHLLVFAALYYFGVAIEYAQEYSNKFFHARIHGRFDPEDVKYNLKGLVAFSVVWIVYVFGVLMFNWFAVKEPVRDRK